jgi:hypothetical protein
MFKKALFASAIALAIASFVSFPAFALLSYVSEYDSDFSGGGLTNVNPCSSPWVYCYDGNVKTTTLTSSSWGHWYNWAIPGSQTGPMDAWVAIPNDGRTVTLGATYYYVCQNAINPICIQTAVNQNGKEGTYVQLNGFTGYNGNANAGSKIRWLNECVPGYGCSSSYPIYVDKAKFDFTCWFNC